MQVPPTIKILFTGLLKFYYDADAKQFEIGALADDAHCLTIGVAKLIHGRVAERKVWTYYPDPDEPGQVDIISGSRFDIEVQRSNRGAKPFPDVNLNTPADQYQDFRKTVCIDGIKFHDSPGQRLPYVKNKFPKVIGINDGTFYSELSIPLIKERRQNPTSHATESLDLTWYVGADIQLSEGEYALLKYRKDNQDETSRMAYAANTNYVIFIENGCHTEIPLRSEYTDFDNYYEVFTISPSQQLRLKVPAGANFREDERRLVLDYAIIWYTRHVVWGSYSPLNFGNRPLILEVPGSGGQKAEFFLTVDNLCIPGRTLNKYW